MRIWKRAEKGDILQQAAKASSVVVVQKRAYP